MFQIKNRVFNIRIKESFKFLYNSYNFIIILEYLYHNIIALKIRNIKI